MFYDDFPLPSRNVASALGRYSEHLVMDYGATNLPLGVLLVSAAVLIERRLVQASLVAWLFYTMLHVSSHRVGSPFLFGRLPSRLSSLEFQGRAYRL